MKLELGKWQKDTSAFICTEKYKLIIMAVKSSGVEVESKRNFPRTRLKTSSFWQ